MPVQALALAAAASIYPPAVAAIVAFGRGADVRPRVLAFVLAAFATTYAIGALMLLVLVELGVSGPHHETPSAALDLAIGLILIALAAALWRKRGRADRAGATAKIDRYLHSRRLAFVLGVTLYILPSPIYVAAVNAVARANLTSEAELLALLATVAVMLWMIELPMLALLAAPERAGNALEQINLWFARHGRMLGVALCAAAGGYLIAKALVQLIG
jgi:Sap, sulfolipid-1-addressing protein